MHKLRINERDWRLKNFLRKTDNKDQKTKLYATTLETKFHFARRAIIEKKCN